MNEAKTKAKAIDYKAKVKAKTTFVLASRPRGLEALTSLVLVDLQTLLSNGIIENVVQYFDLDLNFQG